MYSYIKNIHLISLTLLFVETSKENHRPRSNSMGIAQYTKGIYMYGYIYLYIYMYVCIYIYILLHIYIYIYTCVSPSTQKTYMFFLFIYFEAYDNLYQK
jgi:hypothetical protein